ncbi:MAG: ATP-binding protein [Verrucomicrobia bacterium]|nr:ATP-binding protein [Verrucomicrobiota bacterium]
MQPGDTIRLSASNNLADLPTLQETVRDFLERRVVPAEVIYNVCLAVEEILTNTIKFGYADALPHEIAVNLTLSPDEALLVIEDDARAFDPQTAPKPDLTLPVEQRPIGGLGLHLVRSLSSRITYRRQNDRNVLELRFRLPINLPLTDA